MAEDKSKGQTPLTAFYDQDGVDLRHFSDYYWLMARAVEQSLIFSGAVPGRDYTLLDLYRLAQPFVLQRNGDSPLDISVWPMGQ